MNYFRVTFYDSAGNIYSTLLPVEVCHGKLEINTWGAPFEDGAIPRTLIDLMLESFECPPVFHETDIIKLSIQNETNLES